MSCCCVLTIAVGSMGRVLSFEVNPNHLAVARQNVATWTESWNLSRTQTESRWPDNICFYSAGVEEARDYLDNCQDIDGVREYNSLILSLSRQ